MKILSAQQIHELDNSTIANEPVSSIDLMERAATECYRWIVANYSDKSFIIFCGSGNNGGDGLALARLLSMHHYKVKIISCVTGKNISENNQINFNRCVDGGMEIIANDEFSYSSLSENDILIDALYGTGLTRPVEVKISSVIKHINASGNKIVSIDIPSGLSADAPISGSVIKADHTLTFQSPKLSLILPQTGSYSGELHILDINLNKSFINTSDSNYYYLEKRDAKKLIKPRGKFSHKGDYGHALIIAGSTGKAGAALLAARGCLRSGAGLLTVHTPCNCRNIIQTLIPEAMVQPDLNDDIISKVELNKTFNATGIGPGIGQDIKTVEAVKEFLADAKHPVVIDADALNIISSHKCEITVPELSILTPHPKEFERLAGKSENDFSRLKNQQSYSATNKIIVVLKGAHTSISFPDGRIYFNSTGNAGMAKGGSGDVLTGIITALLAQKYSPQNAALLGVYLHGLAGDIAAEKKGVHSMLATDLIESLPEAFQSLL